MSKRAIRALIWVTGISLVGLVVFQVSWMDNILSANEQAFKRDVQDALSEVVEKLEKKEALDVAIDNFHTEFIYKSLTSADSNRVEWIESTFEKKVVEIQDYLQHAETTPEWVSFYFNSEEGDGMKDVAVKLRDDLPKLPLHATNEIDTTLRNRATYEKQVSKIAKKSEYVQLAMHELFSGRRSLQDRLNILLLDSLLTASLSAKRIELAAKYAIYDQVKEEVVYQNFEESDETVVHSDLHAKLYPSDVLGEAGILYVQFPGQSRYILSKVWLTLASSIVFILILLASFGYAIQVIFRQKKLSEVKSDFINNMTHEFKTPISTVSLACEALRDGEIGASISLRDKYLGIIHDENKRLGQQVEKVLQMAVLDRKDFELKTEQVDIHEVISKVVKNLSIQIKQKEGHIKQELEAAHHMATADPVHLTNMIYNLLDNANKYSGDKPDISISTKDRKHGIEISVQDKGIGISKEDVRKVFDKFYRVPTGNLHDVKGFGLGLAYVKSMIDAHGGRISVSSEPKKGSRFVLFLPYEMETLMT